MTKEKDEDFCWNSSPEGCHTRAEQKRRISQFNRLWCTNHYLRNIIAVYKEYDADLSYKINPYWNFVTELTFITGQENVPYEVEQVVADIWDKYQKEMELYKEEEDEQL